MSSGNGGILSSSISRIWAASSGRNSGAAWARQPETSKIVTETSLFIVDFLRTDYVPVLANHISREFEEERIFDDFVVHNTQYIVVIQFAKDVIDRQLVVNHRGADLAPVFRHSQTCSRLRCTE